MNNNIKQVETKNYIELHDLFVKIKENRKTLIMASIIALAVGVFVVVFTPKVYKTQVSLLSESGSRNGASGLMGQLGGLSGLDMGSLMGMDLGGNGSLVLTPDLYPEVVQSTTFLMEILEHEIYFPKKELRITVRKYLQEYTKPSIPGWLGYVLALFKSKEVVDVESTIPKEKKGEPLTLSQANINLINSLSNCIDINVGKSGSESKIFKVSVELQDPYVSAILTKKVVESLQEYIINYQTSKEKKDLEFIEARYKEAKTRYYDSQKVLANYDDSNINVILASANTRRNKLVTENALASSLYQNFAQKLEQARILIQDKTPVFTVIEPAKVPLSKSKPKTILTIFSLVLTGLFLGICKIIWKEFVYPNKA